jgi:hypothetical protein
VQGVVGRPVTRSAFVASTVQSKLLAGGVFTLLGRWQPKSLVTLSVSLVPAKLTVQDGPVQVKLVTANSNPAPQRGAPLGVDPHVNLTVGEYATPINGQVFGSNDAESARLDDAESAALDTGQKGG